jgi:zinc/manganese transport system substrate-binding protein
LLGLATLLWAAPLHARLNVVATLPDFGAVAEAVGGDRVTVTSIARGTEDPHFVDARPSYVRLLNQADVLIEGGAELESGWLPPLVNGARNRKILADAPGHVLLAPSLHLLDVPAGPVDRAQGDVHALGNPHFWLDPANVKAIAQVLADRFSRLAPADAPVFQANREKFVAQLDLKTAEWTGLLAPYRGTKVVTYHKSFDYFLARFGLTAAGTIEPKPGIEPSPGYVSGLVTNLKNAGVRLVLIEPFRPRKTPNYLAQALGAKLLLLPQSVGGGENLKDYFALLDHDVNQVATALKQP